MFLAIDVYYEDQGAKAVGVLFEAEDMEAQQVIIEYVDQVAPYIPGEFYKRELPCILKIIEAVDLSSIDLIIVDGHVYVSNSQKLGLGAHLWEAIDEKVPVIGVAKKSFHDTDKVSFPVYRGDSKKPVFVSAIGIENERAVDLIQNLKGAYRMPSVLKQLDQYTKGTI